MAGPGGTFDMPTPSRSAIEGAGFAVIEDRGLRSRTLNMALDLCEGRRKCDYDDAYESEVVVRQAQDFYDFLNPKED